MEHINIFKNKNKIAKVKNKFIYNSKNENCFYFSCILEIDSFTNVTLYYMKSILTHEGMVENKFAEGKGFDFHL